MIKTKNYELYFQFWHNWWDWALPLRINLEWLSWDYLEIDLQILCFGICFTSISHKYSKELDDMISRIGDP